MSSIFRTLDSISGIGIYSAPGFIRAESKSWQTIRRRVVGLQVQAAAASSRAVTDNCVFQLPSKRMEHLKPFSEIPGPKSYPLVGSSIEILRHPKFNMEYLHEFWPEYFEKYGPILKFEFGVGPTMVMSTNPDDCEALLNSTADNPIREAFQSLKKIRDNAPNNYFNKKSGLLPENGEEWWRVRSRVQAPLLKPKNVEMYLPDVDAATCQFMDRIDLLQEETGHVPGEFMDELYKWAFECIALVALNKRLGCLEPNLPPDCYQFQMIRTIQAMFEALFHTEMKDRFWMFIKTKSYKNLEKVHNTFLELADKSIREAEESLKEAQAAGDDNRRLTVMETLLNTDGLSRADVATMILDMLFAGVDTTSHSLGFTLYLLARNPEVQKTLQKKIDEVVGDSDTITPDMIHQIKYLNYVVKESLRLYPLTMGNARILTQDTAFSGYVIPKGTLAAVFNLQISRDGRYFSRPDEFLPDRWDRSRPHGEIHPFASLPFSHGTRMCIGKRLAEQEMFCFLIRALQKYSISLESSEEMRIRSTLVMQPGIKLPFKFTKRMS